MGWKTVQQSTKKQKMKKHLLVCLFFISQINYSQEKVGSLDYAIYSPKGIYSIVDEQEKKVLLIFNDKTKIDFISLDEAFQQTGKTSITDDSKGKNDYLGYSKSNQIYYTYWRDSKEENIEVKGLDLAKNTVSASKIPFELEKEIIFNSVTVNNVFHVLSIVKNTDNINVYSFKEGQVQKKTLDCSNLRFLNSESKAINFWKLYSESIGLYYTDGIRNIANKTNNSIVLSTQKKKAYVEGDSIILSFDCNTTFNQNLIINLEKLTVSQKVLSQEGIIFKDEFRNNFTNSNSFVLNGKVFLMKTSEDQVSLTIKDFDNKELKKITYTADKLSDYINSDIVQEDGSIKDRRVLEKPNQFTRKVLGLNPAVTGVYEDNKYIISIGGVSYPKQNNAIMIGGMLGGFTGALIGALISYNNYSQGINSYANKKVVYLKCILDENFNHVNEKAVDSNFDKLRRFIEEDKTSSYQTVFEVNKNLIYTSYDERNKKYNLYKF